MRDRIPCRLKIESTRVNQIPATLGRSFCLAVPDLTHTADIKLNDRVSLRRPFEILSSIQSRGLAPVGHVYRAIRGRCCVIGGSGPAQWCLDGKLNDAATQLDPLDRDGRMLDNPARNSFEFCFCG
jgi:hypothetical protein